MNDIKGEKSIMPLIDTETIDRMLISQLKWKSRGRTCTSCNRRIPKKEWACQNYLCTEYLKKP